MDNDRGALKHLERLDKWNYLLENHVVRYVVYQYERAPDTGRLHVQGYIQLEKKQRLSFLKASIDGRAHWELARGSPKENKAYCTKEESRHMVGDELGELTEANSQGKRSDISRMRDDIKESKGTIPLLQLYDNHDCMFKYQRAAKEYQGLQLTANMETWDLLVSDEDDDDRTKGPDIWTKYGERKFAVVCFWGPTGTGKSKRARELVNSVNQDWASSTYLKTANNGYFDNYQQESTLLWEECGNNGVPNLSFEAFLQLIDVYRPIKLNARFGDVVLKQLRLIVFTSFRHPREWFPNLTDNQTASLIRRFSLIYECTEREIGCERPPNI